MNRKIYEAFMDEWQKIGAGMAGKPWPKPPAGLNLPPSKPGASKTPIADEVARKYAPKTVKKTVFSGTNPSGKPGVMSVRKAPIFRPRG
jgi:hypothetical protein